MQEIERGVESFLTIRCSPRKLHVGQAAHQPAMAFDAIVDAVEAQRLAGELVAGRARLEASGGITLENVRAVAGTGVDEISIGALTHSARSLDVSLELT